MKDMSKEINWSKLLKVLIAVLTALAGAIGVAPVRHEYRAYHPSGAGRGPRVARTSTDVTRGQFCLRSMIILSARSKKTTLGLTFCSMWRWASESSSMIPRTFRSLTKGAKREVKLVSSTFM